MKKEYTNYVSISKFVILSIISLGLYDLVWAYRQWKFIKKYKNIKISPLARTIFFPIFIISLVRKTHEISEGDEKYYKSLIISLSWVILYFFHLNESNLGLLTFLTFIPLIFVVKSSNYYWKEYESKYNKRKYDTLIIVIISISFYSILVFFGLYILN